MLANPGSEMMRKLDKSKFVDRIGKEWIYLTVGEAVNATNFMLHKYKNKAVEAEAAAAAIDIDINNVILSDK